MPKSRRNKVVSLTKVKKKPKENKDKLIDSIRDLAGKAQHVLLVSIENERNACLQEIRKRLRPGTIVCARNKVMQVALGMSAPEECQDGIHKIATRITERCALLFTNQKPEDVQTLFAEYRPVDYARSGAMATETVTLPRGVDALAKLPHSIEAHLRQLGLPTQLKEGKIHLLGDHTVCTQGKDLSSDAAQILKLMEVKQAQFTMAVESRWTKGGAFEDMNEMED